MLFHLIPNSFKRVGYIFLCIHQPKAGRYHNPLFYFFEMASVRNFHPVVEGQLTAARAYFLCVVGMLFAESFLRLPPYLMSLRKGGGLC